MAPVEQKQMVLNTADFLDMQDKLANAMATYRGIAMKILEASSNSLHITTDALTNLHSYTETALKAADIQAGHPALAGYTTIGALLKQPKEKIRDFDSLHLPHLVGLDKAKKVKPARKPKDPDAPKRPDTAYLRFANLNREDYATKMQKQNPSVTRGEIAKKLTADWNEMDEKAQQPYKDSYRKEMAEYNLKKADYEARTGKKVDELQVDEDMVAVPGATADSDSDTSSSDSAAAAPTPKGKGAKGKAAAKASPAKGSAKKRKADDAVGGSSKKAKKEDDGKKKKGGKAATAAMTPIDPRLEKLDKESKRQKK